MTQPHTQTYTPAGELFAALEEFCRTGRTGVFRIVTDTNHAASVGLEAGRVVALRYRIRRGAEALPLLGQIESGQYSFNDRESLGEDPALPASAEVLAQLGVRGAQVPARLNGAVLPPSTPSEAPPAPPQSATPEPTSLKPAPPPGAPTWSPAAKAILEAALAEHIGPMAGIVIRNTLAKTGDLNEVVAAIRAKIPNADRARQFEEEVRRKLAQGQSQ